MDMKPGPLIDIMKKRLQFKKNLKENIWTNL
jgi:hypothetical protein